MSGSSPQDPRLPQDGAESSAWRPREQPPSDSYASLRRFRDAARIERQLRESGELPVIFPSGNDGPLPVPNAPLFGPSGLMNQPLPPPDRSPDTSALPDLSLPDVDEVLGLRRDRLPAWKNLWRSWSPRKQVTAVVSLLIILVALLGSAHPFLGALAAGHLTGGGKNAKSASVTFPVDSAGSTGMPRYAAMPLDIDHPPPVLWAESAVVMDETNGTILYAKNPDEHLAMASTTKLMTAVVALAHASPDEIITVTADAANTGGASIGIHTGEKYTLRDLLYGMLMVSGNDAAEAIADGIGGNVDTFVGWMNQTAKTLGMTNTHYVNPHGLDDDGHYSSALDLAILGRFALQIPLLQTMTTVHTYAIAASAEHPAKNFTNEHEPLWWYPGADGGKPGWTDNANFVDVLSAVRNGHHLLGVIMDSHNDWVTDIRDLLNWGFDDFTWVSPREIDQQHWIPFDDAYANFTWDVPSRTLTVDGRTYFPYTGFTVAGEFLTYFNAQGGLNTFGFPQSMPVPDAAGELSQRFDKASIVCAGGSDVCRTAPNP